MLPIVGIVPDLIDTLLYVAEGEWGDAGASALAMIPIFGQGTRVAQYGAKAIKRASKYIPDAINLAKKAKKVGKRLYRKIFNKIGVKPPSGEINRVTEPGKPQFQLKKGEEGLSVFDADKVGPNEILPSFREGSEIVTKKTKEVEDLGLQVVKTPGDTILPKALQDAHMEIRPGPDMTRKQFKKAIKKL